MTSMKRTSGAATILGPWCAPLPPPLCQPLRPPPHPAALTYSACAQAEYGQWFGELGCESQLVHLHGNVALMAAARTPDGARM